MDSRDLTISYKNGGGSKKKRVSGREWGSWRDWILYCDKKKKKKKAKEGRSAPSIHCLMRTPCIIYIQFNPLSRRLPHPPPPPPHPPLEQHRQIHTHLPSPNTALSAQCSWGCEVMGLMMTAVISYLQAFYFMLHHKQEHHSADGLHSNGAIVHLLPVSRER